MRLLLFLTLVVQLCHSIDPRTLTFLNVVSALKRAFPQQQTVISGTPAYDELNGSYLSRINTDIKPSAIFLPSTAADVAKFLKTTWPYTKFGGVKLAVRGGGQQPDPACNNIDDGVTVDLRNLSSIVVNQDAGSVTIGAGVRWASVYQKLQPLGLGVAGGRAGSNGIGGLALEGGLSFVSSREGFIIDNVLDYEVVLASGKVVHANNSQNSDLYKALRGGGNNFGIVTSYTMRTFAQGGLWGGSVFYSASDFPGQVDALTAELNKPHADPETHLMLSVAYSTQFAQLGGIVGLNQVYYSKPVENPPVLKPFTDIKSQIAPLNSLRNLTLASAAGEQSNQTAVAQRVAYMNLHVKADATTLKRASELYLANIDPIKSVAGITASFTLQPYASSLLAKTSFQGGNVLGLTASEGPIVSVLFLTYWQDATDDSLVISTLRGIFGQLQDDAQSRGTLLPFQYMNYAHSFQDPITSYGTVNKKFLQDVSRKYDCTKFFQTTVPGGFKLRL